MEDSQSDSNMFSIRIVSIDYYMATPISGLDVCYRSFQGQQPNFCEAYEVKLAHSDSFIYGKLPLLYTNDSSSQASRSFSSAYRTMDCMPNTIDSVAFMGHREIYNVKESGFGGTAIGIERFQQISSVASSCLQTGMVECGVSGVDCSMYESGHNDEPSLVWVHDKSFENLLGTNVTTDSMGQQNQNCSGGKQIVYNLYGMGHMHLSKMKFCNPVPDTFSPRKSDRIGMQDQNMDKLICMPTDFQ
ncbi:DNA polymerase zeta catalytic subunit-like, partial [Fagus crenata]